MRRTWNTSVSPTIGIVVAGTANIGFGPACAAAGALCVAAPASANAPVARIIRRSISFMGVLPCIVLVRWLARKRPAIPRAFDALDVTNSVLDFRRQFAAVGGELGHHLLVQPDVHTGGIIAVAGIAEFLGQLLARGKAGI